MGSRCRNVTFSGLMLGRTSVDIPPTDREGGRGRGA